MRIKNINNIRNKLLKGEITVGTWQQIPHSSISEILSCAGYDWIAIDMEHGSINVGDLADLFRAIELNNVLPLARLAEPTPKQCKQALDAGAGGVIVPMVESGDQLLAIRNSCCWPPSGIRGVGFSRANLFGKYFEQYIKEAQSPIIVAQIESIEAVNNLEDIIKVEGLDAIMIGPYDLSASLGVLGEYDNPLYLKALDDIGALCKKYNMALGDHIVFPDNELYNKRVSEGYQFIAYGTDGVFLNEYSKRP